MLCVVKTKEEARKIKTQKQVNKNYKERTRERIDKKNPAALCCVGTRLCDGLNTRPGESYRVCVSHCVHLQWDR